MQKAKKEKEMGLTKPAQPLGLANTEIDLLESIMVALGLLKESTIPKEYWGKLEFSVSVS